MNSGYGTDVRLRGQLIHSSTAPEIASLHYQPTPDELAGTRGKSDERIRNGILVAVFDGTKDKLSMYPFNTLGHSQMFLEPKYEKIRCLTLQGFELEVPQDEFHFVDALDQLPLGFLRNYNYGLGFPSSLSCIVSIIEQLTD